jgi:formylglycine-generating enzyme
MNLDEARRFAPLLALLLVGASACTPDVTPDRLTLPGCNDVAKTCGPNQDEDCCATGNAVKGGLFKQINDPLFPATVNDFTLDRFEVVVGRFRQFVADYPNDKPRKGDGAHPLIENSGWDEVWDANLPETQEALVASVKCDPNFRTWTDTAGGGDALPINCVSWYVAFAFCAWDGGRLPTAAEWNYAATGGNEQRKYPWGDDTVDPSYAVYGCSADGASAPPAEGTETDYKLCTPPGSDIPQVGSRSSKGDGKWGQADLAGGMAEWTLDWFNVPITPCDNCANLNQPIPDSPGRAAWGGDWNHGGQQLLSSNRLGFSVKKEEPTQFFLGMRCARSK